ncbi:LysR family transcriptional regulator [Mycobacterium aquaticum]|uniref:HTH lysR-type domain-containing protein n=1 Tax=Mycobacterium aquaticum TaxID=1927124 RepID=A0A1X0AMU7_9MYCO|nr:LysR family transcriptional regulator [Mycobacterium aquaticum]ORA31235.1 hypothetical protein BST13_26410 [Mycobacterium aquaticum]
MHTTHIERADLNLIPPLVALLEERQVSRAATRVGLSQPAMSRALHRLRRLLGDPLLIRDAAGYRLTARAEAIQTQLDVVLPALEALFAPDQFDPAGSSRPVTLAGTDYAVQAFGSAICREVMRQAPQAPVRFHSWREGVTDQIRNSTIDLGLYGGQTTDEMHSEQLFVERFVCVVAADHPLAEAGGITLRDYQDARHVIVDVHDGRQPDVDLPLAKLGVVRDPAVTVAYHAAASQFLPGTDLVATLPRQLTGALAPPDALVVLDAPDEIATMPYRMVWHPAFDDDRRHQWLRTLVRSAVRQTVG